MARIAVFDSGLGSFSVVRAIAGTGSQDIIYYADTLSHPYGAKTVRALEGIVVGTISALRERFSPDLVVVGSNTPTMLLDLEDSSTIGVWPPLARAAAATSGPVGVLATRAVIRSGTLGRYAESCGVDPARVRGVDASPLVALVESGAFWRDPESCRVPVRRVLAGIGDATVCTLSSTHLPFLRDIMERERPGVAFLDPAESVARRAADMVGTGGSGTLEVYASGDSGIGENLKHLGVDRKVSVLDLAPSGTRG